MAEPFIGQIIQAGFNFAPVNYATCAGQLMSISQYTALFSLLGTTYGGDGITTFALPDLQGRASLHQGSGPGLTPRTIGESAGTEQYTLVVPEMAMHNHIATGSDVAAALAVPANNTWANETSGTLNIYNNNAPDSAMNPLSLSFTGGSQPHDNLEPYLVINFCIAVEGIFPSRN